MHPALVDRPTSHALQWALGRPPARPATRALALDPLMRQLLDILDTGVLLVDAEAKLLHANPAAHHLCHANAALALLDGQLQLALPQRQRLDNAIHAAQRGQWSMLLLRQRGIPMPVAVVPMDGDAGCPGLVAALVIGSDGRPSRLSLQFFSQSHGLTAAESAVLAALCDGLKPTQIAAAGGVAVCTVRSQISAVRQKTGADSIGHLLRMVGGLPPVARHAPRQAV